MGELFESTYSTFSKFLEISFAVIYSKAFIYFLIDLLKLFFKVKFVKSIVDLLTINLDQCITNMSCRGESNYYLLVLIIFEIYLAIYPTMKLNIAVKSFHRLVYSLTPLFILVAYPGIIIPWENLLKTDLPFKIIDLNYMVLSLVSTIHCLGLFYFAYSKKVFKSIFAFMLNIFFLGLFCIVNETYFSTFADYIYPNPSIFTSKILKTILGADYIYALSPFSQFISAFLIVTASMSFLYLAANTYEYIVKSIMLYHLFNALRAYIFFSPGVTIIEKEGNVPKGQTPSDDHSYSVNIGLKSGSNVSRNAIFKDTNNSEINMELSFI